MLDRQSETSKQLALMFFEVFPWRSSKMRRVQWLSDELNPPE
jgi:hypothetical protein